MGDWPEFFAFGGILFGLGLGLFFFQRSRSKVPAEDESEERFLEGQSRRRQQVAGLICLVGVLMVICGFIDPKQQSFVWWSMVLSCLPIAAWIALLGMGDALATWAFRSKQLRSINSQRQLVEAELEKLQRGAMKPGETK